MIPAAASDSMAFFAQPKLVSVTSLNVGLPSAVVPPIDMFVPGFPWASISSTVTVNFFSAWALPWLSIAVSSTSALPLPRTGRNTAPYALIRSGSLLLHATDTPESVLVVKVREWVTLWALSPW